MPSMDLIHHEDLRALASRTGPPLVTIMMPTEHVEARFAQNPIRLKNLIRLVQEDLAEQGYRQQEIDALVAPAREALDDEKFWRQQSAGLVMFLSREGGDMYRLPLELEELVVTGTRFNLRPLYPIVSGNSRFFLLALSQNRVDLFQGTQFSMKEIHTSEIPRSLLDALALDDPEKTLQMHSGVKFNKGRVDAIFHGHGTQNEDNRSRPHDAIRRFFQQIDDGIRTVLGDDDAPMILAGVKYYLPIYRDVNSYRGLIDDEIVPGNPERAPQKDLHDRAWGIISERSVTARQERIDRFQTQHNVGSPLSSTELREIISACAYKRVDTLFVPKAGHQWGTYDPESNALELHEDRQPGDDDLFDVAAAHAYLNGGEVHVLSEAEMPGDGGMAAIFRYAPGAPASFERVRRSVPVTR